MKKRILSMLLLVVMLVTALPLSVIPSLAGEGEEETQIVFDREEYDAYNALYVQNGLTMAFDAMALNSYWGEAANARAAFPESPMLDKDYEYDANGDGTIDPETEVYDFTDHYQRYDFDTGYYVVQKTSKTGVITYETAKIGSSYPLYATEAEADAAAKTKSGATQKGDDGYYLASDGAKYKAAGPYRATVVRLQKNASGTVIAWVDMMTDANFGVFATKEDAIAHAATKGTPTEDGGYRQGVYTYYVVGMDTNAAFKNAGTDYYAKVNEWLKQYTWVGASKFYSASYPVTHVNPSNHRRYGFVVTAPFEDPQDGQGYLTYQDSFIYDDTLKFNTAFGTTGATLEMVSRLTNANSNFVLFERLYPTVTTTNGVSKIKEVKNEATGIVTPNTVDVAIDRTSITTFRIISDKSEVKYTQDETVIYSAKFNHSSGNTGMIGYAQSTYGDEIYTTRTYNRPLEAKETAQNHFADLMKWYRVDIDLVNRLLDRIVDDPATEDVDERYEAIYKNFEKFSIGEDATKAAIEQELVVLLTPYFENDYKGTSAVIYAALAARYGLDLSPLPASPKGMLPRTYTFLNGGYKTSDNVKADYEKALAEDYAARWSTDTSIEKYNSYNKFYTAQDAAALSLDFFRTNSIWGHEVPAPTPPYEVKNYEYDLNGDMRIDPETEVFDFTKIEDRLISEKNTHAVLVKSGSTVKGYLFFQKNGAPTTGNLGYPQTTGVYDNYTQNMPRQLFEGEADAKAAIETAKKNSSTWAKYTYEVVAIPIYMIWRTKTSNQATDFFDNTGNFGTGRMTVQLYQTRAEAEAKAASFSTDGYTYTVGVRPVASTAYYQCITEYNTSLPDDYLYPFDMRETESRTGRLTFSQNMTAVGEHTSAKDGATHMYSHILIEDGYMRINYDGGDPYFTVRGVAATGDYFIDATMAGGERKTGSSGAKVFTFRNQNFQFKVDESGTRLHTVGGKATNDHLVAGTNTVFRLTVASKDLGNNQVTMLTKLHTVVENENGENELKSTTVFGKDPTDTSTTPETTFTPTTNGLFGHTANCRTRFYTFRVYTRILTEAEQAQNHFADIAKFFALDINTAVYDGLDDAGKAEVWAAVKAITFDNTRTEAQAAVDKVLNAKIDADYEAMKTAYPTHSAFIDNAREYRLNFETIETVFASTEDMSKVYALSFGELSCADAQKRLEDTYHDIVTFDVHRLVGEDDWNRWLDAVAAADPVDNIDGLLALPFAARRAITKVENNTDKDVIEGYIAKTLASYTIYSAMTAADYNALYVQNGLTQAFDVMSLNSYWGEAVNARAEFPKNPMTYTDYEYDANGDGTIDPKTEVYNFTDHYQRYDFDTDYYVVQKTSATGAITYEVAKIGSNYPLYTTEAEAEAAAKTQSKATQKGDDGYYHAADGAKYKAVRRAATLVRLTKDATTGKYTVCEDLLASYAFDTVADAKAKACELAKVTEPNADGGYQTGNIVYFVVGMDINAAFKQAASKYYTKVNEWLKQYSWIGAGLTTATYPTTAADPAKRRYQSFTVYAAVEDPQPGQGYLVRSHFFAVDGGLNFSVSKLGSATESGYSGTTELTTRLGAGASTYFFMFHNLRPNVSGNNVGSITGFTTASDSTVAAVTKNPMNRDTVDTLRFTVKNNADTDFISLEQGTTTIYSANGTYNGTDGNNIIGYSNSLNYGEIYNLRSYNRAIDEKEAAQNHFVDLAKWYRIDLADYLALGAEAVDGVLDRTDVHAAMENYKIGDDRDAVIKAYYEAVTDNYAEAEVLSEGMLALAREYGLDVAGLVATDNATTRAYAENAVLAARNVDKVTSRDILQTVLDEAILYKAAHGFNGVQVRLNSASSDPLPGVRAIFEVNKTLLEAYAARGNKIAFGVEICDAGGNALAELRFTKGENGYTGVQTLIAKGTQSAAGIREVGEDSLAFAYTVVYGKNNQTADWYNVEFTYRSFLEVDGVRNNAAMLLSENGTFGTTVSAAKVYRTVYNDYDVTDDDVVNMVIGTVGTGLPAAE